MLKSKCNEHVKNILNLIVQYVATQLQKFNVQNIFYLTELYSHAYIYFLNISYIILIIKNINYLYNKFI